ncbi:MAG: Ig-like domain-containing protein [Propionibacteriaceae bacterium]|nr:Ig-like domain-containing protein [Propionibacteriaceae bacterium]
MAAAALTTGSVILVQQSGSEAEAQVPAATAQIAPIASDHTLSDAQAWNDSTLYMIARDVRESYGIRSPGTGVVLIERLGASFPLTADGYVANQSLNWLWGILKSNGTAESSTGPASRYGTLAVDSGRYLGRPGYVGDGATAYFWSWHRDLENHQYGVGSPGYPPTNFRLANGADAGVSNNGPDWVAVTAQPSGSREGTVFWVPSPITAENWPADAPVFPGKPQAVNFPSYTAIPGSEDSWSGGEVLQGTGEIYFSSRFNGNLWEDYRLMIVDPSTGDFAASGPLQPADASDNIFTPPANGGLAPGADSRLGRLTGDMALDGHGNAYILVEGTAPRGNIWYPAGVSEPTRLLYLVRIVPTRDADGNPVHNARWKYNIVSMIRSDGRPTAGTSAAAMDYLYEFFGTPNSAEAARSALIGMAFLNGKLYACSNRMLFEIDTLSGLATVAGSGVGNYRSETVVPNGGVGGASGINCEDMASGQMAVVVAGHVFNDANANGQIDADERGVPDQNIALYSKNAQGQFVLRSTQQTDGLGSYSFLVAGVGDYEVRLVQPNIGGVNAVQSYASSGLGDNPGLPPNQVKTHCYDYSSGTVKTSDPTGGDASGPCAGALPLPYADAPTDELPPFDEIKEPGEIPIYTSVEIHDAGNIPDVDFGITAAGSYGDAEAGPATVAAGAPMHISGVAQSSTVWLGSAAGVYAGPAVDGTAHNSTDDGVYVTVASQLGGQLPLGPVDGVNQTFAATKSYTLNAQVSGPWASDAAVSVNGWASSAGVWPASATWSPTLSGGTAAAPWTPDASASSSVGLPANLRVDVSKPGATSPTNTANQYQAAIGNATGNWTTPGEIEDYSYSVADAVYRVGVKSEGGTGTFTVDGSALTTLDSSAVYAAGKAAGAGSKSISVSLPDSSWLVKSVEVFDTVTGAAVGGALTCVPEGDSPCSFSLATQLGDDVTVLVTVAKYPAAADFTLSVDKTNPAVHEVVTATVSPSSGSDVRPGQVIDFGASDPGLVLKDADGNVVTSCVLDANGSCQVYVTAAEVGDYVLHAKVATGPGATADITDSPVTLKVKAGRADPAVSEFVVTPAGPLTVGTGPDSTYTAKVTAYDADRNPSPETTVTFSVDPADLGSGGLSAATCVTGDDGSCSVTLTSTKSGSYQIHAKVPDANGQLVDVAGGGDPTKSSPATRVYTPDTARAHGTLTVTPSSVPLGGTATATVTLEDDYGNPITGLPQSALDFGSAPAGLSWNNDFNEAAPGVYTVTVTSNIQNIYTVTAAPLGLDLSAEVAFGSDVPRPDKSLFEVTPAGPLAVGTGDANTYTLKATAYNGLGTANDGHGDPVAGAVVTFAAAGDFGLGGLSATTCTTGSDGSCAVTATSTKAGTVTFSATLPDPDNSNQPGVIPTPQDRVYTAGPIDPAKSSVVVTPDPVTAGEDATATVTLKDRYDNPITGLAGEIGATLDPAQGTVGSFTETAPGSGVYTAPVTGLTEAGPREITATIDSAPGVELTDTFTVDPADPDPDHSTFVIDPNEVVVKSHTTATFTIKDRFDNPISGLDPTIAAGPLTAAAIQSSWGSEGQYKWDLTTAVAGDYEATASLATPTAFSKTASVKFVAGDVCRVVIKNPDLGTAEVSLSENGTVQLDFQVLDCDDNPVQGKPLSAFALSDRFHQADQSANPFAFNDPGKISVKPGSFVETTDAADPTNADKNYYSVVIASKTAGVFDVFVSYLASPNVLSENYGIVTFEPKLTPTVDVTWEITPEQVTLPGTALGALTFKDEFGNGIGLTDAQINITSAPAGVSVQGEIVKGKDQYGNPTGEYSITLASGTPGLYTVTVAVPALDDQRQPITIERSDTVEFVSPSAGIVTLAYDPTTHVVSDEQGAGVTATVQVTGLDTTPVTGLTQQDIALTTTLDGKATDALSIKTGSFVEQGAGVYTFLVYSQVAGSYSSTATVEGAVSAPASVTFNPGEVHSATWTIEPSTVQLPDVGPASATGIYTLLDQFGNKIPNKQADITVTADPTAGLAIGAPAYENGSYRYTLTASEPETYTVTASHTTLAPLQATVTFTRAISPVDSNSSVTVRPADGSEPVYVDEDWIVTVTAVDSHGRPVTGLTDVSFTLDPTGPATIGDFSEVSPGVYEATVTTTKSGVYTVNAKAGGVDLDQHPTVTFLGGPDVDPANSFLSADPLVQTAGLPVLITITAHDKYDNPVTDLILPNGSSLLSVTGTAVSPDVAPDITVTPGTWLQQRGDGVYTADITSTKVGHFRLTGLAQSRTGASAAEFLQHPVVEFVPGPAGGNSHAELIKPVALADGQDTVQVKVYAVDDYGNPAPGAIVVGTRYNNTALTPDPNQVTTGPDGTAILAWTSTVVGKFTANITVDDYSSFDGATQNNLSFVTGDVDPETSTLEVAPTLTTDTAPIEAGHSYTAKVTLRDSSNHPVEGGVASFAITEPVDGYTPVISAQSCTSGADGVCSIQVTSTKAAAFKLTAKVPVPGGLADITGSPAPVVWKPGAVCVPAEVQDCKTRVVVTKDNQLADGIAEDEATLYAFDRYGNPTPDVSWSSSTTDASLSVKTPSGRTSSDMTLAVDLGTAVIPYSSLVKGSHPATVTVADKQLPGITLSFTDVPWAKATLTVSPTTAQAAGENFTLTALIEDAAGAPINGAAVTLQTSSADLTFVGGSATCTTSPQGTCSLQVTSTKAGVYQVGFPDGVAPVIVGSPATVEFTAGALDHASVTVIANGAKPGGQGQDVVRVEVFDKYNIPISGATAVSTPRDSQLAVVPGTPATGADGTTQIAYTASAAGSYQADVTVEKDGKTITPTGSPVTLLFSGVDIYPPNSSWELTPSGPLEVGEGAANTYTATVTARDQDNDLVVGGVVSFEIAPAEGPQWGNGQSACTTGTNGQCSVTVYSTKAGSYSAVARVTTGATLGQIGQAKPAVWTPGPVCDKSDTPTCKTHVEVTKNGAVANGVDPDIVTVYAFDRYDNPVPGQPVMSTSADADLRIEQSPDPTGNGLNGSTLGVTTISYYSTKAKVYSVSDIQIANGKTPDGLPVSLSFVAGCIPGVDPECPEGEQSYLEVTRDHAIADGQDTDEVTLHLVDQFGNPVPNVAVASLSLDSKATVKQPVAATDSAGVTAIAYTSSEVGAHQVSVSVQRDGIWREVKFQSGYTPTAGQLESPVAINFGFDCIVNPDDPACQPTKAENQPHIVVTIDNQKADGNGHDVATVTIVDRVGHPVPGLTITSTTADPDLTIQPADTVAPTDAQGSTTIWYSTTKTGGGTFAASAFFEYEGVTHEIKFATGFTVPTGWVDSPFDVQFVDTLPAPIIVSPVEGAQLNDNTPEIRGTGEPGADLEVKVDGVVVGQTVVQPDGTWSVTPSQPLEDGAHRITATQADEVGVSPEAVRNIVIDTTPPPLCLDDPDNPDCFTITRPAEGESVPETQPVFEGTGEPGDAVSIVDKETGQELCSATVDSNQHWTCTSTTPLAEGEHTVIGTITDPAGNQAEEERTFVVDTIAPSLTFDRPAEGSTVPDTTPTFSGASDEPGAQVTVKEGGTTLCTATVQADLTWSCDSTVDLPKGPHTVVAQAEDAAGNTSQPISRTFTVDPDRPDAPTIDHPAEGAYLNDSAVVIDGAGVPGAMVEVTEDGTVLCTTPVQADGSWSCSVELADGPHSIEATQTTPNGLVSDPAERNFTVDTVPPPLCADDPTAPYCFAIVKPAEDELVNDNTPTFEGTGEPGDTVTVTDKETGEELCSTVVGDDGLWECTSTKPLPEGENTVIGTITDPAGNQTDEERTFTVDTTPPCVGPADGCFEILRPAEGESVSDSTPTFSGKGEPAATVVIAENGVTLCVTTVLPDKTWSCESTQVLPNGSHTVEGTTTDPAGNSADPVERTFTIDTSALLCLETPDGQAPAVGCFDITQPQEGAKINDTTPDFVGVGEPGGTVTIREDNLPLAGCVDVPITQVDGGPVGQGTWTCTLTQPLADGEHTAKGVMTDAAGNDSNELPRHFTVDTRICTDENPDCFTLTTPHEDEWVNDNKPTFSGTGEPGGVVVVTDKDSGVELCEATVQPDGSWSCRSEVELAEGPHTVQAVLTDEAGNVSDPIERHFGVDTVQPVVVITAPTEGEQLQRNAVVTVFTPTIRGTGEPLGQVTVTEAGVELCTAEVLEAGTWACVPTRDLLEGPHSIVAVEIDKAGNVSPEATRAFAIIGPLSGLVLTVDLPTEGQLLNDSTPQFSGTADLGIGTTTVSVTDSATQALLCEATVVANDDASGGTWSCDSTVVLPEGPQKVIASATDSLGSAFNSVERNFTVDTVKPCIGSEEGCFEILHPEEGSKINDATPTFDGKGEPGGTVEIKDKDTGELLCETTVDSSGDWNCTPTTPLAEGPHTVVGTLTDEAGNVSDPVERHFTVDTTAPVTCLEDDVAGCFDITRPAEGSFVNEARPHFEGTGEPAGLVVLKEGDVVLCTVTATAEGTWSCESTAVLPDGPHTVTGTITDEAGNVSSPVVRNFTVDTVIAPPVVTKPSEGESVNTEGGMEVAGTAEPNSDVTVKDGDTGVTLCTAHADATGHWSCEVPEDKRPGEGDHQLSVTAEDAAGNVSEPTVVNYTVDNTGPFVYITSPADGASVQGSTSNPLVVTGVGETVGDLIQVDDGRGNSCSTQVGADLTWSCVFDKQLPEGQVTITATATDQAGNTGTDHRVIVIDRTPPAPPTVTEPTEGGYANTDKPTISGKDSEPGNTILVKDEDGRILCEDVPVQADGTWTCQSQLPLDDGEHTIIVTEKDPAGNVSDETRVDFTVDTTPPDRPVIVKPAEGSTIKDNKPSVEGTAEPGATVHVSVGDDNMCTTTADAQGNWACTLPKPLPDGPQTAQAVAVDRAGNLSEPAVVHFTVDTVPPTPPTVDTSDHDVVEGDTDPNTDVTVVDDEDGHVICQTVSDSHGHWSCVPDKPLKPGDEITVIATDDAGNSSSTTVRVLGLTLKPSVAQGEAQVAHGSYFQPGESVHAVWYVNGQAVDLGWQTANANGDVEFTWTIPVETALGEYTVELRGERSGPVRASFQVVLPIPATGSPVGVGFVAGAGSLALFGALFIVVAWRRRREEETATAMRMI